MGGTGRATRSTPETWPSADRARGVIDLHMLPPVPSINGARIRELTGEQSIPADAQISLRVHRVVAGDRRFVTGFCLGDGHGYSAVGIAVIDRLMMEAPGAALHVVPVVHRNIAWDIVLRHLRTFTGQVLLFAFPDSETYDAGAAEVFYSPKVQHFDEAGAPIARLTQAQRRRIKGEVAMRQGRPEPPPFYAADFAERQDAPWVFQVGTPAGKQLRAAVWDGRRDYAHEMPEDIAAHVGGNRIAIVQLGRPVGTDRRSALRLTHALARDHDGVVLWARDTETFQSILHSFIRLDIPSAARPELPEGWNPEVVILPARDG